MEMPKRRSSNCIATILGGIGHKPTHQNFVKAKPYNYLALKLQFSFLANQMDNIS